MVAPYQIGQNGVLFPIAAEIADVAFIASSYISLPLQVFHLE
jgi:hypothetical protein